jgi:hypothetical protein
MLNCLGRFILPLALSTLILGCSGSFKYTKPTASPDTSSSSRTIPFPREQVWNAAIASLGKRFFVINNLDKSSGLVNISYSGDPEKYVDCGEIKSVVSNLRGERVYDFPAAQASADYEILSPSGFFGIHRTMKLDGRVNVVFEDAGVGSTEISVHARYVLERSGSGADAQGRPMTPLNDSIAFNSGQSASFPRLGSDDALVCVATGALEHEIIDAILAGQRPAEALSGPPAAK